MSSVLNSKRVQRLVGWASALLLVAGIVAFATVRLGGDSSPSPGAPPQEVAERLIQPPKKLSGKDVPREARVVAGQFILAAAGREDLKKAWRLTHPTLKAQCACTYKEWLTGNIPVQYYPVQNLDLATFAVEEVTANTVVLHVALLPEEGSKVKPQSFFIGLKANGTGKKKQWLVDYWAPYASIPVPAEAQ
jgi:hypothetical protein